MICPRCSVAEISPDTNRCVLCGYSPAAPAATITAQDEATPSVDARVEETREELAQLFHVERVLGDPGFVTTYIAREAETERKVVLRVLPRHPVRDAGLEDRLLRELAAAASLDHPHIVPVFRFGATTRCLWYSNRHVPGQSLGELLRTSGPLELHPSLHIIEQVGSALQYAHRRGIVHADVRPANVRVDPNGWSLLTGFAVGRVLDRLPLTTLGGRPVRQPDYLAPEERYSRQPGPGADQYGLAALVFECLTGTLPFAGMGPDDAIPPALAAPRPDVPEHVAEALRRALSQRPGERFQSVLELVAALESEPPPRLSQPAPVARPQLTAGGRLQLPPPAASAAGARASRRSPPQLPAPTPPGGNPPVLLVGRAGPWRVLVRWALGLATVGAAVLFGPQLVRQFGGRAGQAGTGAPGAGLPRLVERDSGFSAPAIGVPLDTAAASAPTRSAIPPAATATAPPPVRPTPAATPAPVRPPAAAPAPGRLFVNARPWGQVYLDGQLVGNTPQANLVVSAGTHRLRVVREGFAPFERVLQVAPGQELRLTDIVLQDDVP
jgi:serine/threonine-protein kinase